MRTPHPELKGLNRHQYQVAYMRLYRQDQDYRTQEKRQQASYRRSGKRAAAKPKPAAPKSQTESVGMRAWKEFRESLTNHHQEETT